MKYLEINKSNDILYTFLVLETFEMQYDDINRRKKSKLGQ